MNHLCAFSLVTEFVLQFQLVFTLSHSSYHLSEEVLVWHKDALGWILCINHIVCINKYAIFQILQHRLRLLNSLRFLNLTIQQPQLFETRYLVSEIHARNARPHHLS